MSSHDSRDAVRVFELVKERMELVQAIAAWKWLHCLPLRDRAREDAVLEQALQQAIARNLYVAPVRHLFELQIRCARQLQRRLHRHWTRNGFRFAGRVPSLEDELRPQLDRLTERLLKAIQSAGPLLAQPSFAQEWVRWAPRLRRAGWSSRRRQELLAALAALGGSTESAGCDASVAVKPMGPTQSIHRAHELA